MIYIAIAWYFDISYQEALDIYDDLTDEQLFSIERAYVNYVHGRDGNG